METLQGVRPNGGTAAKRFDTADTAMSQRRKARLAGMNPHYWYPAEWSDRVARGRTVETQFWGDSIALYRGEDGHIAAVENRCAHRHIKLTLGQVEGCNLTCLYHGWQFDRAGQLVGMHHDDFGKPLPKVGLRAYPVRERYGIVWIFPGAAELADQVPLPDVLHGDGSDEWASMRFDFTWRAHHSLIIDNLCNLTHLYVHGSWAPYDRTTLASRQVTHGERVEVVWAHTLRRDRLSPLSRWLFRAPGTDNESTTATTYDYPYEMSVSNNRVRTANFVLPLDTDHTRVFTIQMWRGLELSGGSSRRVPAAVMRRLWIPLLKPVTRQIFRQDGAAVEAENEALREHFDRPIPEPNPAVRLFERVAVERWEAAVAYQKGGLPAAEAGASTRVKVL